MPKKGFYSKTPVVPESKIAGQNPVGHVPLGTMVLAITPAHPGHMKGTGMLQRPIPHPYVKGSHGYGHGVHARKGNLRVSGHPSAHQIGKVGKLKKYTPTGP